MRDPIFNEPFRQSAEPSAAASVFGRADILADRLGAADHFSPAFIPSDSICIRPTLSGSSGLTVISGMPIWTSSVPFSKPGDTMIDVGANIGFTVMEGAHVVGSHGVVHAIEPHPFIHRCLEENLSLNHSD